MKWIFFLKRIKEEKQKRRRKKEKLRKRRKGKLNIDREEKRS